MSIEISIPAFNEESIIARSVSGVVRAMRESGKVVAITVVDNASTDQTGAIAGALEGVSVLSIAARGKGAAVIGAARRSSADFFGFIDADLSVDPKEIIPLLALVESGQCDIAIGSRLMDSTIVDRGMFRSVSSRVFNIVRRRLVGVQAQDTQCGLKLMNARGRAVLSGCLETGWFFDVEFLARAERQGLRIREVPVRWHEYHFPGRKSKLNHVRETIESFRAMLRIRRHLDEALQAEARTA